MLFLGPTYDTLIWCKQWYFDDDDDDDIDTWGWESKFSADFTEMPRPVFYSCTQVIGRGLLTFFPVCFNLPFPGSRGTHGHGDVILGRTCQWTEYRQKQHYIVLRHLLKNGKPSCILKNTMIILNWIVLQASLHIIFFEAWLHSFF